MKKTAKIITIFGSAVPHPGSYEYEEARTLGRLLAEAGFVVCNGGYAGTMEASAKGAKEAGGKTVGVTVKQFGLSANSYIDEVIETESLFGRLEELVGFSDAYVVLKGGSGTLVELVLSIELILKGLVKPRPVVVLGDFFSGVVKLIRQEATKYEKGRTLGVAHKLDDFVVIVKNTGEAVKHLREKVR